MRGPSRTASVGGSLAILTAIPRAAVTIRLFRSQNFMWLCAWQGALAATPPSRAHERALLLRSGGSVVAGIDEAGVGAIAGPVVAAAVRLPDDLEELEGRDMLGQYCRDSKTMTLSERRDALAWMATVPGMVWSDAIIPPHRVDAAGGAAAAASLAMRIAARRLERKLAPRAEATAAAATAAATTTERSSLWYLVDGATAPAKLPNAQAVVRGDGLETCIAAASVVASATHDLHMARLALRWPLWDFDVNCGWPSREHLRHIVEHGPSGCHRASCFPFQRRHGRRLGFHPDRAAYAAVQAELRRARLSSDDADADAGGGTAPPEDDDEPSAATGEVDVLDEATAARRRRYREFVLLRASSVGASDASSSAAASSSRRTRRRRGRARSSV